MAAELQVVSEFEEQEAIKLDKEIRHYLTIGYVEAGRRLIEMRDGNKYLSLPDFKGKTFEDYVRTIEGTSIANAQRIIRASIVMEAMGLQVEAHNLPPTEYHVRELVNEQDFQYRTESRSDGKKKAVPVALKKPSAVAKRWERICDQWETKVAAWQEKNVDKEPPRMSATFVRLHSGVKGKGAERVTDSRRIATISRMADNLTQKMDYLSIKTNSELAEMAAREKWDKDLKASVRTLVKDLRIAADGFLEKLSKVRLP